jgi:predicted DNA-binding transcriptional regulator AlpA
MSNLVSQSEYARLCGVSRQAISDRIKNKLLFLCDGKYINIVDFPPKKLPKGRKLGGHNKGFVLKEKKLANPVGRPLEKIYDFPKQKISLGKLRGKLVR